MRRMAGAARRRVRYMVFSATSGFGVGLVGHRPPQGSVPSWLPGVPGGRPPCVSDLLYLLLHPFHVHSPHCHRIFQRYSSLPTAVDYVPYPCRAFFPPPVVRRCPLFLFSCEVHRLPPVLSFRPVHTLCRMSHFLLPGSDGGLLRRCCKEGVERNAGRHAPAV